jgi:hypothetical protein
VPTTTAPPTTSAPSTVPPTTQPEICQSYSGDYIQDNGLLAEALFAHYLLGSGTPVVVDWSYFTQDSNFPYTAKALGIGGHGYYQSSPTTNLFWALGTFSVYRTGPSCYRIYDHYDFTPDKVQNTFYEPVWALQMAGAKNFDVYGSGKL